MGCYYLTIEDKNGKGAGRAFSDMDEAMMAYQTGSPSHAGAHQGARTARMGRADVYPPDRLHAGPPHLQRRPCRRISASSPATRWTTCSCWKSTSGPRRKHLGKIVDMCFRKHGAQKTAEVLDAVKKLGYNYSTVAGVTVSVYDILIPPDKKDMLAAADARVTKIMNAYRQGLLSDDERYLRVTDVWAETTTKIRDKILPGLHKMEEDEHRFNPVLMMTESAARGSISQVSQLAGMRGLMASPSGKVIELPIRSNFKEGLSVLEFFLSTHGSRKSLADTALRTADSGYLTRRLVEVSQELIIREDDCFASRHEPIRGITITRTKPGEEEVEKMEDRLMGRFAAEDIIDPATGEVIVPCNEMIDYDQAARIGADGNIQSVTIRSVLTCHNEHRRVRQVLRHEPRPRRRGGYRRGRRRYRRAVHRRTRHAADDAYVPHRRRRFRRGYHAGSSPR